MFISDGPVGPVPIDFTMTFALLFDNDLKDPTTQLYKDTAAMSTDALRQILNTTTAVLVDEQAIVWVFTEGSIIATAEEVEVDNVRSVAEVEQQLQDFDETTIPDLQTVALAPAGNVI